VEWWVDGRKHVLPSCENNGVVGLKAEAAGGGNLRRGRSHSDNTPTEEHKCRWKGTESSEGTLESYPTSG
jgi:hypothetical protein